jgi:hypothetical protein
MKTYDSHGHAGASERQWQDECLAMRRARLAAAAIAIANADTTLALAKARAMRRARRPAFWWIESWPFLALALPAAALLVWARAQGWL